MLPLISIVVPVFNAEEYLPCCVESILAQTYSNWELILVNDGSLDRSGTICDAFAEQDSRIHVIHQSNSGVSTARNIGIDNVKGEWILFVDADDTIHHQTLEICSQHFNHTDVIRFSLRQILSNDGPILKDRIIERMSHEDYLSKIVSRETPLGVCGGMYRTKLINDNQIRFNPTIVNGEDWLVLATIVNCATNCLIIPEPLYIYNRTNNQSRTYSLKYENAESAIKAFHLIKKALLPNSSINNKCFARAKCDLVYDYVASQVNGRIKVSRENKIAYRRKSQLSFLDVIRGSTSIRMALLLSLYISYFGRLVF